MPRIDWMGNLTFADQFDNDPDRRGLWSQPQRHPVYGFRQRPTY